MTNRYEVKGTDEFFLHIQDNEEWPEDKAEGYIMFPSSMNRAVMDALKEFVDDYPYDKNRVKFEVINRDLGNNHMLKQIRWKTAVNRDDIEYACYVLTQFLLDNF